MSPQEWAMVLTGAGYLAHGVQPPLTKLIETVSAAIGEVYRPAAIRAEAEARGEALTILARKEGEAGEIAYRAAVRIENREIRRQRNIENILRKAAASLPAEVSDVPVDPDWAANFFDQCQDVGNEDMQKIWGKLLAGEVDVPGSFSTRTMRVVKELTPEIANQFTLLCSMVWSIDGKRPNPLFSESSSNMNHSLHLLDPAGLIRLESMAMGKSFKAPSITAEYFEEKYVLSGEKEIKLAPQISSLTDTGRQLMKVAGAAPIKAYRDCVIAEWRSKGITVLPI